MLDFISNSLVLLWIFIINLDGKWNDNENKKNYNNNNNKSNKKLLALHSQLHTCVISDNLIIAYACTSLFHNSVIKKICMHFCFCIDKWIQHPYNSFLADGGCIPLLSLSESHRKWICSNSDLHKSIDSHDCHIGLRLSVVHKVKVHQLF